MPEQYRALAVILTLAFFAFYFSKKIVEPQTSSDQFKRWRNAWFTITLVAFLANNFWIYIVVDGMFIWYAAKKVDNKVAFFLAVLFAVPMIDQYIPVVGLDKFVSIHYARLLSLTILYPAYLALRKMPDTLVFGRNLPDKLLLTYMVLTVALLLRNTSFTDMLRGGIYAFIDIFLPYYVASRGIKNLQQLKEVMVAFTLAGIITGTIAFSEFGMHWLLYASLADALNVDWYMGNYLGRGSDLRALASVGQPIVLGYVMMLTLGTYLFMASTIKNRTISLLGLLLVLVGLFAPLSRGPWIGAVVLVTIFIATGRNAIKRLTILGVAMLLLLPTLAVIPGGEKIINLLPFVGEVDAENVDYRKDLFNNSIIVFQQNPLLGSVNFREDLANMGMTQGEGIVDIVNSYIEIILEYGLVGLTLFLGFFSLILLAVHNSMRRIIDKKSQQYLFGRTLISCIIGILFTIFTVSSIQFIPVIYWTFAGLGITYARLANIKEEEEEEEAALPTSRIAVKQ
jgi:O-antigen ligase